MHEWHFFKNNTTYGPISAKQLKQYAVSGEYGPTDHVGVTNGPTNQRGIAPCVWAPAEQIVGLFGASKQVNAIVHIHSPQSGPSLLDLSPTILVTFDNMFLGAATVKAGFHYLIEATPGTHTLSVSTKTFFLGYTPALPESFQIDLEQQIYHINFLYDFGPYNYFSYRQYMLTDDISTVNAHFEDERQAAQCPYCNADWAITHLGEKILGEREKYKTVNRNIDRWNSYPEQVVAIETTIRDFYRCDKCSKSWTRDRTSEHVP